MPKLVFETDIDLDDAQSIETARQLTGRKEPYDLTDIVTFTFDYTMELNIDVEDNRKFERIRKFLESTNPKISSTQLTQFRASLTMIMSRMKRLIALCEVVD
jgi:hypothetical protein